MKEKIIQKPNMEERHFMIAAGVIVFYLLIEFFIIYLFCLHRINFITVLFSTILFSLIYLPRFLILYKLKTCDKIQIIDDFIMINEAGIPLADIKDYRLELEKPQVVFFFNNKMIVFRQAKFHLKLDSAAITFTVIGSEKIKLLEEFLNVQIKGR